MNVRWFHLQGRIYAANADQEVCRRLGASGRRLVGCEVLDLMVEHMLGCLQAIGLPLLQFFIRRHGSFLLLLFFLAFLTTLTMHNPIAFGAVV